MSPQEGLVFVLAPRGEPAALRFSAVARCGDESPLLLALMASFSASEGIRKDTGIISWIRWPNAVTIVDRIVATTSATVAKASGGRWTELDFQVNLSHANVQGGTSLHDALGVEVDRGLLLDRILESLAWMHFGWSNGMHTQLLRRIRSMTETIGMRVSMQNGRRIVSGSALNVDSRGRLVVRLDDGRTETFSADDELLEAR